VPAGVSLQERSEENLLSMQGLALSGVLALTLEATLSYDMVGRQGEWLPWS